MHDTTCDHNLRAMSWRRARRDQPCAHRLRRRVGRSVVSNVGSNVGSNATSTTLRAVGCALVAVLAVSGCTGSADKTAATDSTMAADGTVGADSAGPGASASDGTSGLCLPPQCGTSLPFEPTDGFVGPAFGAGVADPVVLPGSVTVASTGDWSALGLVAGAQTDPATMTTVTAELRGSDGAVVASVSTTVLVAPLRAGEPGPFRIDAPGVPAADVADVAWSVTAGDPVAPGSARTMGIDVFWTRPAGGRPVDMAGYVDSGGAGSPLVTYAGVSATGTDAVVSPGVVAAWIDGSGRVVAIATADVLEPGTAVPLGVLDPGATADAVVVLNGPVAPMLADVSPMLWAVGRP